MTELDQTISARLKSKNSKVLVHGAGPLGSLFAARLCEAGHDVSLLARGQRLDDLKKNMVSF